jgi:hypothetical protein
MDNRPFQCCPFTFVIKYYYLDCHLIYGVCGCFPIDITYKYDVISSALLLDLSE